jgi:cell division protein FtsI (penicillin-binding protein 3)
MTNRLRTEIEKEDELDLPAEQKTAELPDNIFTKFLKNGFITTDDATRALPFVLFVAFLGMIYIGNRHLADNNVRKIDKLKKEVKELNWGYKVAKADMAFKSTLNEVAQRTDTLGIRESIEGGCAMSIRTNILLRVYIAFGLILLLSLAVIIQLYRLQYIQGDKWKQMASKSSTRYETIEAVRGNIYSVDGSLLATSVPEYELHMDMIAGGIVDDKVFFSKVDSLAASLSKLYPEKSVRDYSRLLREARKEKLRYQLIRRRVTFSELKKIRQFPIFNLGKFKGGLVVEQKNKRILPFKSLAARTIGYKNENVANGVGLEGAFTKYISGEDGKRLMQRIPGGVYVPVNQEEEDDEQAKDGADIISTIDVNYQDLAQKVLKKQLDSIQADFGTVVLMEVATGEIRAIANFTRTPEGEYKEKMNYAIAASAEPGSTFKLASYLAMIDDKKIDTNSVIDAAHGTFQVMNPRNGRVALKIRDTEDHGGPITAKRAFEESSNIAVARFVNKAYGSNPQAFIDKLYSFHLNEPNDIQIKGEGKPRIKNTRSEDWNKIQSLWQIAYGYESKLIMVS